MAEERTYVIPLRKEWMKAARYRRSKRAVSAVRSFIHKHMKTDDVRLGRYLNMELWSRGNKKPPHKVAIKAVKVEEKDANYVKVELVGAPEEKVVEKKKGLAERLKERVTGKEEKPKVEKEKKEKKKVEEKKETPKEEVKEKAEEKKEVSKPIEEKKE